MDFIFMNGPGFESCLGQSAPCGWSAEICLLLCPRCKPAAFFTRASRLHQVINVYAWMTGGHHQKAC